MLLLTFNEALAADAGNGGAASAAAAAGEAWRLVRPLTPYMLLDTDDRVLLLLALSLGHGNARKGHEHAWKLFIKKPERTKSKRFSFDALIAEALNQQCCARFDFVICAC